MALSYPSCTFYLVLARDPDNPPGVQCLASISVWLRSRPGEKPDPRNLGRVVTRTRHKPSVFWLGWFRPAVQYYGVYNIGRSLAPI